MIEIRNVSLRLDGKSILNNISLTLEPGKIYGLVGSNVPRYILKV
jgi:ABC-2 type transport system ATP-binding protein